MITIKSKKEIEYILYASKVVAKIHEKLKSIIKVGVNGQYLNTIAEKIIKENNCVPNFLNYYGFPASICVSVNEQLVHGIPNSKPFKYGDIVSVDVGCKYKGYNADAAFTVIIGKNDKYNDLVISTKTALDKAISILKPGIRIGDISNTIENFIKSKKYFLPRDYTGHGIGLELHEDPAIPNFGPPNKGPKLVEGMVICIEPMVQYSTHKTKVLDDGWTVVSNDGCYSAHFEHTILITSNGSKVLSIL